MLIEFKTVDAEPSIDISESGTKLSGNASLKIMNPLNTRIVTAIINITFASELKVGLTSGFNLTGSVEHLQMNVTGFRAFFRTQENAQSLA